MEHKFVTKLNQDLLSMQCSGQFVSRCCRYAAKLLDKGLPVFFDEVHIKHALRTHGMPLMYDYHSFRLQTGHKTRTIDAPSARLKKRQRWILDEILSRVPVSKYAHGFEPNRSIKTHAQLHARHGHVICMDIQDFFPSITQERVTSIFQKLGYTHRAAQGLAKLCCCGGVLPQGAPTSPKLANIVCKRMDREIGRYIKEHHITYSRYADDLTFSSNHPMPELIADITGIIEKHGFRVNVRKTRCFLPAEPKFITGLVVQNGVIHVPKQFKRELRKEIHFCQKLGVLVHLQNTGAAHYINYREHLYGKAYYINMIEPDVGARFLDALDQIPWPEYML